MVFHMGMPSEPVTLTVEQIAELNRKLSAMRHNINNQLALVSAASELLRFKPELREKMATTLGEQPPRIMSELAQFSADFERLFGISRD